MDTHKTSKPPAAYAHVLMNGIDTASVGMAPVKSMVKTPITATSVITERKPTHSLASMVPILQFTSQTGITPVITSGPSGPMLLAPKPGVGPYVAPKPRISASFASVPVTKEIKLNAPFVPPYESEQFKTIKEYRRRTRSYLTQPDRVGVYARTPSRSKRTPIYLWFDGEMTQNHDPRVDEFMEVAAVLTDDAWFETDRFTAVVKHDYDDIERKLSDMTRSMHTHSGLLDECKHATLTTGEIEQILIDKLKQAVNKPPFAGRWTGQYVLAGTGIDNDKDFIKQKMPRLFAILNRSLHDVRTLILSSRSGMFGALYVPHLEPTHRAIFDVEDSLYTMRLICEHCKLFCVR